MPALREWKRQADALFLMQKRRLVPINAPLEVTLLISEGRMDLDNGVKQLLDAAKEYGLVPMICQNI